MRTERVDDEATALPMLVNGRQLLLPVIHAKGHLADSAGAEDIEFQVLDDPGNPLLLRSRGPGFTSSVVKIEYPKAKAVSPLEHELAARHPAEVDGIYFFAGRADSATGTPFAAPLP